MSLTLTGKITQILPLESGEGKNGQWKKQSFIMQYKDGSIDKTVCMTAWGDKVDQIAKGDAVVSFAVESREYNGKWYTDVKPWKIEVKAAAGGSGTDNDLPF